MEKCCVCGVLKGKVTLSMTSKKARNCCAIRGLLWWRNLHVVPLTAWPTKWREGNAMVNKVRAVSCFKWNMKLLCQSWTAPVDKLGQKYHWYLGQLIVTLNAQLTTTMANSNSCFWSRGFFYNEFSCMEVRIFRPNASVNDDRRDSDNCVTWIMTSVTMVQWLWHHSLTWTITIRVPGGRTHQELEPWWFVPW